MRPGRNLLEGIVQKIRRRQRKEGFNTIEYYSVTLQTVDGYVNFRMEGQPPNLISRFRENAILEVDMIMNEDARSVLRLRGVNEIPGFKGSDIRSAIQDPTNQKTAEPTTSTVGKMNQRVKGLLDQVSDPTARQVIEKAVELDGYKTYQAAMFHHHNYEGGLMRHSVGVAEESLKVLESVARADIPIRLSSAEQEEFNMKEGLLKRGSEISKSVVIAGALLHDIGKLQEYTMKDNEQGYNERTEINYHTTSGQMIVDQIASSITDPDADVVSTIKNIIASHHVKEEYRARDIRRSPEAFVVSMGDSADTELSRANEYIHERYLDNISSIANSDASPEIAKQQADRARKSMDVQKEMINSPTGGFEAPTKGTATSALRKGRKEKKGRRR